MSKFILNLIMSLLLLFQSCMPSIAQGLDPISIAAAGGATDLVFGKLLDSLEKTANDVIDHTDAAVDKNTFLAMQRLLLLVQSIRTNYAQMLDKTSATFTAQEKQVFQGLEKTVQHVDDVRRNTAQDIASTLTQIDAIASAICPYADGTQLLSYTPEQVVYQPERDVQLTLTGRNFIAGNKIALVNGDGTNTVLQQDPASFGQIKLALPAQWCKVDSSPKLKQIIISLPNKHQNMLQAVFNQRDFIPYKISIWIFPAKFGTYTVGYSYSKSGQNVKRRSEHPQQFFMDNCAGWISACDRKDKNDPYLPSAGFCIDVASVSLNKIMMQGVNPVCRLENVAATGFTVHSEWQSERRYGRPARVEYEVSWNEYEPSVVPGRVENHQSGPLNWGEQIAIKFPIDAAIHIDGFLVTARTWDGQTFQSTGIGNKYFDVNYDPTSQILLIQPLAISKIRLND